MLTTCRRRACKLVYDGSRSYARLRPHTAATSLPPYDFKAVNEALSRNTESSPTTARSASNDGSESQSVDKTDIRQPQEEDEDVLAGFMKKRAIQEDIRLQDETDFGKQGIKLSSKLATQQQSAAPVQTAQKAPVQAISRIPPEFLYDIWDTQPPTTRELAESRAFFMENQPKKLFRAQKLLEVPFTDIPEVAILGRSNVGKSSLINRIFNNTMAKTSCKPGKTTTMNGIVIGDAAKICILDMPGYGRASREQWGVEIMKYLSQRKELKRVFLLIDCIGADRKASIKKDDRVMMFDLANWKIPHQIVITKADRIITPSQVKQPMTVERLALWSANMRKALDGLKEEIWNVDRNQGPVPTHGFQPFGQLLAVSSDNPKYKYLSAEKHGALGIDAVRWAILVATGMAKALPSAVAAEKRRLKSMPIIERQLGPAIARPDTQDGQKPVTMVTEPDDDRDVLDHPEAEYRGNRKPTQMSHRKDFSKRDDYPKRNNSSRPDSSQKGDYSKQKKYTKTKDHYKQHDTQRPRDHYNQNDSTKKSDISKWKKQFGYMQRDATKPRQQLAKWSRGRH